MSSLFKSSSRPSSRQSVKPPTSPSGSLSTIKAAPGSVSEETVYENEDGTLTYVKTEGETSTVNEEEIKDGENQSEGGKVKQMLGILRKMLGVKDLAAVRLSLPSNLLEPRGNLEYWCYLDRPDIFVSIGESDDEVERMMEVVRFSFTKELKFIRMGIIKPYNSALGEQFRCFWDVAPAQTSLDGSHPITPEHSRPPTIGNGNASRNSSKPPSVKSRSPSLRPLADDDSVSINGELLPNGVLSFNGDVNQAQKTTRVVFLNEQVSHHPPISTFWHETRSLDPSKNVRTVQAYGVDQIAAKFTGTSVRVGAGSFNKGIFVNLPERGDEEYQITHPTASIVGLVKLSPYITITEHSYITRRYRSPNSSTPKKQLRAVINYVEESWIGRARFYVKGFVFECDESDPEDLFKDGVVRDGDERVKAKFEGSWKGLVKWRRVGKGGVLGEEKILIDLNLLDCYPKTVRPIHNQGEMESQRFWHNVSEPIRKKQFNAATKAKQEIEQKQRDKAAALKAKGEEHKTVFFTDSYEDGRPTLTEEGKKAIEDDFAAVGY